MKLGVSQSHVQSKRCPGFCVTFFFVMDFTWSFRGSDEHAVGAAMRRRQRRLRSWLRHERMTVAMALTEMTHHAAQGDRRWPGPGRRRTRSMTRLMVDQLAVLKPVDSSVPDRIIAVPKISLPSRPLRAALAATQMVEQLVEVPTDVVVLMETDTEEEDEEVPCSLCSSSSTEWWKSVVAAVPTVTHSANCAVLGSAV